MKYLRYCFIFLLISNTLISQNRQLENLYESYTDSIVNSELNKTLALQKQLRNKETLVFLKDSVSRYYWTDDSGSCAIHSITYYSYDEFGRIIEALVKNGPQSGCSSYKSNNFYTYENGNLIEALQLKYNFTTNEWENYTKTEYQYDENNYQIERAWIRWNTDTSTWENYLKFTNLYDGDLMLEDNRHEWREPDNEWFLDLRREYSYNENGDLLFYEYNRWDSNEWETLRRTVNVYDNINNLIESTVYKKYSNENEYDWTIIERNEYNYDANNFIIEKIEYKDWNNISENWDTILKYTYLNNPIGNPTEAVVLLWNQSLQDWRNDSLIITTYNSNSDILEIVKSIWQSNQWMNSKRYTYSYNSNFLKTEELTQDWESNYWMNFERITKEYNEYNNLTLYKLDYWYNGWYSEIEDIYEYDEYQNLIHYVGYYTYDFTEMYFYYSEYDIELSINENELQNKIIIYPNPATEIINIKGNKEDVNVVIYDLSGKELMNVITKSKVDISLLQKGIYIIKILDNIGMSNVKMIKL